MKAASFELLLEFICSESSSIHRMPMTNGWPDHDRQTPDLMVRAAIKDRPSKVPADRLVKRTLNDDLL